MNKADHMRHRKENSYLLGETGREPRTNSAPRTVALLFAFALCAACVAHRPPEIKPRWTNLIEVQGQPEPVPADWVGTPEGQFAHSIRTPNKLPKDSGYRRGMTTEQYFDHLCHAEAGEFIFRTVRNVEGLYFMRPPKSPTDVDLQDRFKLEAPDIERTFQLLPATPIGRAETFVNPPWARYAFIEEPADGKQAGPYLRVSGYRQDVSKMKVESVSNRKSEYGLIWRGIRRLHDRELAIAGSEWIVVALATGEVMGVQRNYARAAFDRHSKDGTWWLNGVTCPNVASPHNLSTRFYEFAARVLMPPLGEAK